MAPATISALIAGSAAVLGPSTTALVVGGAAVGTTTTAAAAGAVALTWSQVALIGAGIAAGVTAGILMQPGAPTARAQNVKTSIGTRRRGYGRYRVGGQIVFQKRSVLTGDGILYMAHAIHTGEIDAIEQHWIGDQITRTDPLVLSGGSFSGITSVTFPAIPEADRPPAYDVVITAYDAGYSAETVTAHYTIAGIPHTLDSISVGVIGGAFQAVVFPGMGSTNPARLKPVATSVTFTTSGAGTGASFSAIPNGDGFWDGGHLVTIDDRGSGYADTVGGYGFAAYANRNGVGRWDGGGGKNVAIGTTGTAYSSPTITAHWFVGSVEHTLVAASYTLGTTGAAIAGGVVIYPPVWLDNYRVTVSPHLGLAHQDADIYLLFGFPGIWSTQHRLDGVAYVVLKLNGVSQEVFPAVYKFGIPTYQATIRASKIWDPRDPAQDENDPDTWLWSDNAALVILDYMRHADGMRLPAALFTPAIPQWIAAADYADDEITLLSGETEPRFRLSGDYEFNTAPKDVLGSFLRCVDGRLRLNEEGAIELDLGQFDCPTSCETIATGDILGIENFRRGAPKAELRNEIRANYLSPGHKFQSQEADPWRDEDSVLIDGLQSATLDLLYCSSHRQARQLMKVARYRLNPEWMGTIVTNAKGLRLLGKRYARFQIAALGLDTTFFIKRSNIDLQTGKCTFEVISFPAEAYCWDPIEEGVSPEHETPGNHGIAVPPGAISVNIRVIGGGGGGSQGNGGGGGGYAVKHVALSPADEGVIFTFTVGAAGIGHAFDSWNMATNGGQSTVTGTVAAGSISITANGGTRGNSIDSFNGGFGGTATGGDTNTSGHNRDGDDGGASGAGAIEKESPGGGGHRQIDGGIGEVTFEFEF